MKRIITALLLVFLFAGNTLLSQETCKLEIRGTRFYLDGAPFEFTGISFFNAIYNQEFNKSSEVRRAWIRKIREYGINVFRVWCQWDNARGFADGGKESTMYHPDGSLDNVHFTRLKEFVSDAAKEGSVILLVLFSKESWNENIRLSDEASKKAVASLTASLKPYRNMVFQIWNEHSYRTFEYFKIIKNIDPGRIVTNSPGYAGDLGSPEENKSLDYL